MELNPKEDVPVYISMTFKVNGEFTVGSNLHDENLIIKYIETALNKMKSNEVKITHPYPKQVQ